MTKDEDDKAADWRGMSGSRAFHFIDKNATCWDDVNEMMGAWLRANQSATTEPLPPIDDDNGCARN